MNRATHLSAALAVAAVAWTSATPAAAEDCKLLAIELPVTMSQNRPLIAVSINGHPMKMLLDTGADRSIIFRSAASALKLDVSLTGGRMYGAGGGEVVGTVSVADFGLGQTKVRNVQFLATGRLNAPVGDVVGLLGEDVLSHWDLDLDLSAGKANLMTPRNCKDEQVVYWAKSYDVLPLNRAPGQWLWAHVQINGHQMIGMFDTGAVISIVAIGSLQGAGVRPETEFASIGKANGIAGNAFEVSSAIFPSLSVGQESIQNARLQVADLFGRDREVTAGSLIPKNISDFPDMLVGADFFLAHHVYVARSQQKIYFTYKGGPIFQAPAKRAPDQHGAGNDSSGAHSDATPAAAN